MANGNTFWDCVPEAKTVKECEQQCDLNPNCGAFDIEEAHVGKGTQGECCLFLAGHTGDGKAERACYKKTHNVFVPTEFSPKWAKRAKFSVDVAQAVAGAGKKDAGKKDAGKKAAECGADCKACNEKGGGCKWVVAATGGKCLGCDGGGMYACALCLEEYCSSGFASAVFVQRVRRVTHNRISAHWLNHRCSVWGVPPSCCLQERPRMRTKRRAVRRSWRCPASRWRCRRRSCCRSERYEVRHGWLCRAM